MTFNKFDANQWVTVRKRFVIWISNVKLVRVEIEVITLAPVDASFLVCDAVSTGKYSSYRRFEAIQIHHNVTAYQ